MNEQADMAALDAIQTLPQSPINIPRSDHQCTIRQAINNIWKEKWIATRDNKLKNIQTTLNTLPCYKNNRNWTIKLNRLRIGHTKITHGFLMERREREFCEDCLVPQSVIHLIVECPTYSDERRQTLGARRKTILSKQQTGC